MDNEFKDITNKDTIEHKSLFRRILSIIISFILLFAIFSIIITLININNIQNNKPGYLIHNKVTKEETNYIITNYDYLIYKIIRIDGKGGQNCYFRLWFMDNVDY